MCLVATATGSTAYWTGQGKAVKVSPLAFSRATMARLKIGALVVLTNTLLSDSKPESEQLVKRDLVAAVATLSDVTLLDPTNAGISGSTPAAITHGATTITGTGDVAEDLAAAVDAFAGNFATAAWVMAPRAGGADCFASGGRGIGADLGMRGGTLLGLPAIVSGSSPFDSSGGQIALVDAANIVVCDEGAEITISKVAMVEMDDNPTGDTITPTAASAHMVSLFRKTQPDCS